MHLEGEPCTSCPPTSKRHRESGGHFTCSDPLLSVDKELGKVSLWFFILFILCALTWPASKVCSISSLSLRNAENKLLFSFPLLNTANFWRDLRNQPVLHHHGYRSPGVIQILVTCASLKDLEISEMEASPCPVSARSTILFKGWTSLEDFKWSHDPINLNNKLEP